MDRKWITPDPHRAIDISERYDLLDYPTYLEDWWMGRVQTWLSQQPKGADLSALNAQIQALSDQFIEDDARPLGDYGRDLRMLLAYGLFYFPRTFVATQWPLCELLGFRAWKPAPDRAMKILDLGAGLGAASLAAAQVFAPLVPAIEICAVDHSPHSLEWYGDITRDLSAAHWPNVSWHTQRGNLRKWRPATNLLAHRPEPVADHCAELRWDLIISSFALTEAFVGEDVGVLWQWLVDWSGRLTDNGLLLLIEPASRVACTRLMHIRDQIATQCQALGGKALFIWGPCLHHLACPLLAAGQHWCHEVRSWQIPDSLALANRRLFHDLSALKFGFLAIGNQPPPALTPAMHSFA
jgi:ribosomal protein RSM22 (predicted rRNA methylase)